MNILIFIIILLVLIISHEFGHFIVAKKSGMRVDEFSFGFPPKLFGIKKGETSYNFNLLPIGGYVKIHGENPSGEGEENENKDNERSFTNKPWYLQALVLIAGVSMNFLLAWILFTVAFSSGFPSSVSNTQAGVEIKDPAVTITSVAPDSPASLAGLMVGDKLISFKTNKDITETPSFDSVKYFIKKHKDESIIITYERSGEQKELSLNPKINENDEATIGISMDMIGTIKLPILKAVWEGLKFSGNLFVATIVGFYHLISGAITGSASLSAVTGPIGLVGVIGDAANFGFIYLLSFTALISINLAVINLIPFPALDGGRLLFLVIERIKGSRINPKITNIVNSIGFLLLMLLMVVVSYNDIIKLF